MAKKIRKKLKLKKAEKAYLRAIAKTLSEWDSTYDEAAYEYLQNI